ncbi:MAG TPA: isocitrate lyase/phosphoenolpyruvate mutase family protein [Polyangiales bacterium]|nr:isocitrate lyase/phosphoenolpyruvate mutase family protein [Polyangiales bacterium]
MTTFGPYSPGQAVTMKRVGIEGIYLGGWATSAKGSLHEDPGPDLASYPLSQVPDEAATLVRALLTADRNQQFSRARLSEAQRKATPEIDYRPFIIADADTGHGGDAHVRNLIRRFVEVGVPGYHIEDQKPGAKKCGHQGGKVLVSSDEQIKRLNAARLQLDIMGVPGIIVARTDAEAATLVENNVDERDQPFILGATNLEVPTYKAGYAALQRKLYAAGVEDATGYQLFGLSEREYEHANVWLTQAGVLAGIQAVADTVKSADGGKIEAALDAIEATFSDAWQQAAGLKTYSEAVADAITFRTKQGEPSEISVGQWQQFAATATQFEQRERAQRLGLRVTWDDALPKTPDGYYQVRGGIDYAIAKSLAVAPFADIIWMETKTADLHDAKEFAAAIHAKYPQAMLAYNLSPSFNWDTTGMTEDQMRAFPEEIGKLGFVFNFITYGGHQVDGLAGEEFATALKQDGCLALARLQRKLRLIDSPYKTPQSHVGGPRLDAALLSVSGRTAATKAMGKGSTQFQHLVQTEVSTKTLEDWLGVWSKQQGTSALDVNLRPQTLGAELLELALRDSDGQKILNVVFNNLQDRSGRQILSIRDQNTVPSLRRKRLMTLAQLFLIHRYKVASVHYLTPTDDNQRQALALKELGLFKTVESTSGLVILAEVNAERVSTLVAQDGLKTLVAKKR